MNIGEQLLKLSASIDQHKRQIWELAKILNLGEDNLLLLETNLFHYGAYGTRKKKVRICAKCGKKYVGHRSKFCSKECVYSSFKKPVRRIVCASCGIEFEVKGKRKYCDKCKKSIFQPSAKVCPQCGKEFLIAQRAQKYCSKDCKNRFLAKNKHKDRTRIDYLKSVGKCEGCGESDKRVLHAHHVRGRNNPELMVLCANCHYKYHNSVGKGINSENRTKEEVLKILETNVSP